MKDLKTILKNLNIGADYISLRAMNSKKSGIGVRNESFEYFNTHQDSGVMIEVMMNGHFAHGATQSFDENEIKEVALKTKQRALLSSRFGLFKFSESVRPKITGEYISPAKVRMEGMNPKDLTGQLISMTKVMNLSEKVNDRSAHFELIDLETHFVSSNGSDVKQSLFRTGYNGAVNSTNDQGSQRRSFGGESNSQFGLEVLNVEMLLNESRRVAEESLRLLEAPDCPSDSRDLMLSSDIMYLQIHESIGHPLELDRILGDERNYAGWSFVKPNDFGNLQYGSQLMNVTYDPTVHGQNASFFADDIGNRATREFLIEGGLLKRALGSLESQARSNILGVANQRSSSWNRPPIDRMGNINLEPGSSSLESMIKSCEKGVLMKTTRSWSIDDYRNKFQFGTEYGQLIEDGRLTTIVKNPNYRGITTPFWNKLKMVGDRSTYEIGGLANCGKGEPNQLMFVGHASPVCVFSDVEVFGGGK